MHGAMELGYKVTHSSWDHETLEHFRKDARAFEVSGPDAVKNKPDLTSIEELRNVEVLVVQFCPVTSLLFEDAPNIKFVGVVRAGVENVDLEAARSAGVCVANVQGRNAQAVAEYTIAMLLTELRDLARSHAAMREGKWQVDYPGSAKHELQGSTIGVVGVGQIGKITISLLAPFGCRILVYDPHVEDLPDHVEPVGLDDLFERSDHVILHARLRESTKELVGKKQIFLLKPHSVLVNTARAGLIDEDALIEALEQHRIGGAALDVFNKEPLPSSHPFVTLDNVTTTPHIACETVEANANGPRMMSEQVISYLNGRMEGVSRVV